MEPKMEPQGFLYNTIDNERNGMLAIPLGNSERLYMTMEPQRWNRKWNRKGSSTTQSTTNVTECLPFHCGVWNDGTLQCNIKWNIKWNRKGSSTTQSTTNCNGMLVIPSGNSQSKIHFFTKMYTKYTKIK
jgi:hypothetical protein